MNCVGKMITYEDLLFSSKFFYTEGSEDSSLIFPDEIKEYGNTGSLLQVGHVEGTIHGDGNNGNTQLCSSLRESTRNSVTLDINVAMEAACGDPTFLVSKDFVSA